MPKLKMELIIKTPTVPNFLRAEKDKMYSIAEFSDDQLREVGKAWTERLIERKREILNNPLRKIKADGH